MNQLVHQSGDRLIVTTLEISNRFGKQHKNVLRDIEHLECTDNFRKLNFEPTVYHRPNPKGGKAIPAPMYELTRDGFTFLCMGFTGSQAALWKERYIEAFNQMEAALRSNPASYQQQLALATQVGQLKDMVRSRDSIITVKDGVIMGLQDKLIGSQGMQIQLIGKVSNMQRRQHNKEIIHLIERMEIEGKPRREIANITGKCLNYIRQCIFIARRDGRLPALPEKPAHTELNLEGGLSAGQEGV